MPNVLSYPFRLTPDGRHAVVVQQDSDVDYAEQLAQIVLTRPGERELAPDFGVPDPAFGSLDVSDVVAVVQVHGPPVTIHDLTREERSDTIEEVLISFSGGVVSE
ncbi:MAG TPA: hypothetical protein VM600_10005 [Actinomycetota bacterium]|nr:hypothetical protein [Actinomycetota bacterium]